MAPTMSTIIPLVLLALAHHTTAHVAAFAKGMYCLSGPDGTNLNSNAPVSPLFDLSFSDFWFQHDRGCDAAVPANGDFLEIPAGGSFTVELANNQAFTTLSYDGENVSDWPDGKDHPDDWHGPLDGGEGCIQDDGWIHTQNESTAQGTAWAIAYSNPSNLADIKIEDLAVFSVAEHTPWHRLATYDVPEDLQECPEEGCTCAWLWVPKGCGQPNVYMQGFRCKVTRPEGSGSGKPLAKAQAPVYCEGEGEKCVQGAKQIIIWNQQDGVDNVEGVPDVFLAAPGYNSRCGYESGAQKDIFGEGESTSPTSESPSVSATPTSSSTGGPGEFFPVSSTTTTPAVSITATPAGDIGNVAPPPPASGDDDESPPEAETGGGDSGSGVPGGFPPGPPADGGSGTSPVSFSSTVTGRFGRPTKFTCYIDED
jgi:hypothetical protein